MPLSTPPSEIPHKAMVPPLGAWLEAYVRGDREAFTKLVRQVTPLVMAAALRRCGGHHALAQEAAQAVFVDLARRAPSLRADATLTGWLHQRATRAAGDLMKQEQRRTVREQQVATPGDRYSLNDEPDSAAWMEGREEVDAALSRLKLAERTAVMLRCAEGHGFEAVGKALGCSAGAARKKVDRALAKLRAALGRHRTGISAVILMRGLAEDQARAASGAGMEALSHQLAGTALAAGGKITWLARTLPWLKAAGTGAAAAAAVWAWPVAARLWPGSAAIPLPVKTSEEAMAASPPGLRFPAVPPREPIKDGLTLDEIVQRLAAMVEGPDFSHDWTAVNFYAGQITPERTGLALTKLKRLVSPQGWRGFLKRSWAEEFFKTWAALDGPAALDFLLSDLDESEFQQGDDDERELAGRINNLTWRCIESTCGLGFRENAGEINAGKNARLLMTWVTALLKSPENGGRTAKQEIIISRGTELASSVVGTGDPSAIGQLVELVNQHGFKWMDFSVTWIKSTEILATMLEVLPRLDSPEQRTVLQLAVLRKMAELDLPAAMRQVESVSDPAQRWKFAESVGSPVYRRKMGKVLMVDEAAKPKADWWFQQAVPGQEEAAAQTIVRSWLGMDPEWALDWGSRKIPPEAALVPLQEAVRQDISTYAFFGTQNHKDMPDRLRRNAGLLQKRDQAGAGEFLDQALQRYATGKHIEAVGKLLKP